MRQHWKPVSEETMTWGRAICSVALYIALVFSISFFGGIVAAKLLGTASEEKLTALCRDYGAEINAVADINGREPPC